MTIKIGFTGTQFGMTKEQLAKFRHIISARYSVQACARPEFHHGDCLGADAEAHSAAGSLGYYIIVHPPSNDNKRAFKHGDLILSTKPYLDRNKDIVRDTDQLIATPAQAQEQLRSGTWSTIRFARKLLKPISIILPNGNVIEEATS